MLVNLAPIIMCLITATSAITTIGQKHSDRGYIPENVDLNEEDVEEFTEDANWNDSPKIWRWNVQDFPHPKLEPRFCQRLAPSSICDPDQVLTSTQAAKLDVLIRALFNETPCICESCDASADGIQLGIAIFKNIYKPYNERPSKTIQAFTKNLRSKWRLGDCNDDILIVVVTDDRLSYTDVGAATSRYIPQDEAYSIFLENIAHFSEKRYYDGLGAMLGQYRRVATRIPRDKSEPKTDEGKIAGIAIGVLFLVGIAAVIAIWIFKKYRKKGSETSSDTNGGDFASSTWRKNFALSPSHISTKDTTYAACKTVDDIVQEEADNQCSEPMPTSEEETFTTNESPEKQPSDSPTEGTSSSTNDDVTAEAKAPFTTFLPNAQKELHQTDL